MLLHLIRLNLLQYFYQTLRRYFFLGISFLAVSVIVKKRTDLILLEKEFRIFEILRELLKTPPTRKHAFLSLMAIAETLNLKKSLMLPKTTSWDTVTDGDSICQLLGTTDVTFHTSTNDTVSVAKISLQNSRYFNALLFGGFKEAHSENIFIPDIDIHMLKVGSQSLQFV